MFISPNEEQHQEDLVLNIEKPQGKLWWEKKGFILAAVFSSVWLAFIWDYLVSSGWWGFRHELSPAEFIGGFCGLFLPILLVFFVSSYFDRSEQIAYEAQTLRSYLSQLIYPTDANGAYTKALTKTLKEQVKSFKDVFIAVEKQTKEVNAQLQSWSMQMMQTSHQLDVQTKGCINEISERLSQLTQAVVSANEQSIAASSSFNAQISDLKLVVQQSISSLTPVTDVLQAHVTKMTEIEQTFEKTNTQTQETLSKADIVSSQIQTQMQSVIQVIEKFETNAAYQEDLMARHLTQAETVLSKQNEALKHSDELLKTNNETLRAAENIVNTHNQFFDGAEAMAKTHYDILGRSIAQTKQQMQTLEDQIDGKTHVLVQKTDNALNKLLQMNETLAQTVQTIETIPTHIGAVQEKMIQTKQQVVQAAYELQAGEVNEGQQPSVQAKQDLLEDATLILDRLQSFSVDMAHIFTPKTEDTLWKKYYAGDKAVFMRHITRALTESQHNQIIELYQTNSEFQQAVSRYMSEFEEITKRAQKSDENKLLMSILIGSDVGRLYMVLADILRRNAA